VSNNNSELASLNYTKSKNGINWSQPMAVFDYNRWIVISPTVVCLDSIFIMWTVNSGKDGWISQINTLERRTSSNGIDWSEPQVCSLYQPNYIIWHIDVIYVDLYKEYWMLFSAYPKGERSNVSILFFAKSKDGHLWQTFERPLINKGKNWDKKSIYRATALYNENTDTLKIYYSAINIWDTWKVGSIEVNYSELNNILKSIKIDDRDNDNGMLPETYSLFQNYPNPFNNLTIIGFLLGIQEKVSLEIYDTIGSLVRRLISNETKYPGKYEISWDGKNDNGIPVPSGIYFYKITSGNFIQSKKMVLLH
jgi:hypothetical protein